MKPKHKIVKAGAANVLKTRVKKSRAESKLFIIAAASIIVIIMLVILLFVGKQFVGKAFYTGDENTAGLYMGEVGDPFTIRPNTPFDAIVKANIGGEAVGVSFELALPAQVACANVESLLEWDSEFEESEMTVLNTARCEGNRIIFEYVTLDWAAAKTGEFEVARISFNGISMPTTYTLDFTSFDIISLEDETRDFIDEGLDAQIIVEEVEEAEEIVECTADNGCGAGFRCQAGSCILAQEPALTREFSTSISAARPIPLAIVYTILRDEEGVILVFKSERMENIAAGGAYIATATYPFPAKVATKEVYVQDRLPHQGWTVHGRLQENVATPQVQASGEGITLITVGES